jgi:hypothetical protein
VLDGSDVVKMASAALGLSTQSDVQQLITAALGTNRPSLDNAPEAALLSTGSIDGDQVDDTGLLTQPEETLQESDVAAEQLKPAMEPDPESGHLLSMLPAEESAGAVEMAS